ncbi:16242_t:CDS:2, partial [Cetraspora pellucida]
MTKAYRIINIFCSNVHINNFALIKSQKFCIKSSDSNNEYNSDSIPCTSSYANSYTDPYADPCTDPYTDPYTNPYTNSYTNLDAESQNNDDEHYSTAVRRKTIDRNKEDKSVKKIQKEIEEECGTNLNDLEQNSDKKHQLHIDQIVRKVISHRETIQVELRRVTTEWLVTDFLLFITVHG